MSADPNYVEARPAQTATSNLTEITGIASLLVAANILLMLVMSYTPAVALGRVLFSNFFFAIGTFVLTVGGGYWLASRGVENGSMPLAGAGVTLTQLGYGLFGATVLAFASSSLRVPALAITTVVTALITAVITVVVFKTDHSFERWQLYSGGLFITGIVLGAIGAFAASSLLVVAGVCFFLGFVTDLTYEIWAVKTSAYASPLLNAIGIYVAVMGVFIHVLQWVLRVLEMLDL
ncbi:hypothetical protein VB773_07830 [Haloarculaceae archaeon H-GB2-1]|nr:hypothetical protein [Haloarculaceae archaeon H-GB1-1]MEA5385980.1 hypothetical protein [Haloarculaceae archaeon H-GB11]MEA5407484.1 hypothetical protein [Haloarculaceae archaeon H-GB2-1]